MFKKIISTLGVVFLSLYALNATALARETEVRGVWVATVGHMNYPYDTTTSEEKLKAQCDEILDNCADIGFNTVYFQVRPASDALYNSNIFPWSGDLTGSQGQAPENGFDPLKYWIEAAHARNIELHAWINPYRVTKSGTSSSLSNLADKNPAKQHPEWCVKYTNGNYYYNPALPEARDLIKRGVEEIVQNYDIDGIHFDDYFYPGSDFNDSVQYAAYGNGASLADWRRENVNTLIKNVHDAINAIDPSVEFGISPSGVWANASNNPLGSDTLGMEHYSEIYCDSVKWAQEGWVDYLCPQVYWEIGHPMANYDTLARWWSKTLEGTNTKLYIGMADYKVGNSGVWSDATPIRDELVLNDSLPYVTGEVHFSYSSFENASVRNVVKSHYVSAQPLKVVNCKKYFGSESEISEIQQPQTTTSAPVAIVEATVPATQKQVKEVIVEETVETTTFDVNSVVNTDRVKVLVYVDGQKVNFDQEPVIINSRTMVPLRKVFESFDADVDWNNSQREVTAVKNGTSVKFKIDSNQMTVNGSKTVILDSPAVIRNSRTLVPVRAISEAFGYKVGWNDPNRVVTVNTK
ncbi:MAG: family 10 glycosylhydrolase [Firmicutes bacterium]|nr:family 10 glycosylhydrolase [Bacillota bacterium]